MRDIEGLEIGSPKGGIRGFLQVGLFTEALAFAARNLDTQIIPMEAALI